MRTLQIALRSATRVAIGRLSSWKVDRKGRSRVGGNQHFVESGGVAPTIRLYVCTMAILILVTAPVIAEECQLKTIPKTVSAEQLLAGYVDTAFAPSVCYAQSDIEKCDPLIERLESNYFVLLQGIELLGDDMFNPIALQINQTASDIRKITGVQGFAAPKEGQPAPKAPIDASLFVAFVDRNQLMTGAENYVETVLSQLRLAPPDIMAEVLFNFASDEEENCLTVNRPDSQGYITASVTWIKSNLTLAQTNQCVARAFVGGMGLLADAMFDSGTSADETAITDDVFELPDDFKTYLEIHYSGLVHAGMTRHQAMLSDDIRHALECR
jgi:hypothetical protein